mmetsp:Transcript_27291/g.43748  ORF Transcript_27291/g.43748 Transcript_27291/m.43748 type:complete len:196 (+) Transcript_27291:18-605(+)
MHSHFGSREALVYLHDCASETPKAVTGPVKTWAVLECEVGFMGGGSSKPTEVGDEMRKVRQEVHGWGRAEYIDKNNSCHTFFRSEDGNLVVHLSHAHGSSFKMQIVPQMPKLINSDGSTKDNEEFVDRVQYANLPFTKWALRVQPGAEEIIGNWRLSMGKDGIIFTDITSGDRHILADNNVQHHSGKRFPAVDTE